MRKFAKSALALLLALGAPTGGVVDAYDGCCDDASWESSLPTEPGSELTGGYLKLTSGIATVRFLSGAESILEAPANLVLKTPMYAMLTSGAARVEVPTRRPNRHTGPSDFFAVL